MAESFADVVDLIFGKLAVRYGAAWLRQWDGVDMGLVKADWRGELSGFSGNLKPLRYALRHLPERCPGVGEFKAMANRCPPPVFAALPVPVADPVVVAEILTKAKAATKPQMQDHKQWARVIMERHKAGERLPVVNVEMARRALGARA